MRPSYVVIAIAATLIASSGVASASDASVTKEQFLRTHKTIENDAGEAGSENEERAGFNFNAWEKAINAETAKLKAEAEALGQQAKAVHLDNLKAFKKMTEQGNTPGYVAHVMKIDDLAKTRARLKALPKDARHADPEYLPYKFVNMFTKYWKENHGTIKKASTS